MKKILIAAIIAIAAAGILYLGYLFSFRRTPTAPSSGVPAQTGNIPGGSSAKNVGGGVSGGALPQASFSQLAVVADMPTLDYFIAPDKSVTVIQPDAEIVGIKNSQTLAVSSSTVTNLVRASFSADGKRILGVFGDSFANQASVFDMDKTSWQPLPAGIQSPAWAPANSVLAYFNAGTLSTLDIGNPASKPKTLLRIRLEDAALEWPASDTIFIEDKPSAAWQSSLWAFSLKAAALSPVIEDQPGLETAWSSAPPLRGVLFAANANGEGGSLSLVDQNGKTLQRFSFLTLPSKCVFTSGSTPVQESSTVSSSLQTSSSAKNPAATTKPATLVPGPQLLVCAVPRDRRPFDINPLPDAYQKKLLFTSDDFYAINLDDGSVKTLFNDQSKNLDAANLKVFGQTLYFVNRYDQKLYSLPIGD